MKRKPTLTIYKNKAGRFNWTLRAANGEPLAKGCGEKANGFASARSAWRNANRTFEALDWMRLLTQEERDRTPRVGVLDIHGVGPGLRITRDV